MGCGSSKGSVVPLEAGGGGAAANGNARRVRVGGGTGGGARVPGSGQSRGLSRRPSEAPAIEGRDPPEEDLPKELPELREIVRAAGGKNMAFEVPLSDDKPRPLVPGGPGGPGGGAGTAGDADQAQGGARRPPRRLQRLEDAPVPPSQRLTHRLLDERQEAADERRLQILTQRVQSAQQRVPTRRARDGADGDGLGSSGSYVDSLAGSRGSRNEELLETLNYAKQQRGP